MHFKFSPSFPSNFNRTYFCFSLFLNPNPNRKKQKQNKTKKGPEGNSVNTTLSNCGCSTDEIEKQSLQILKLNGLR